MHKCSCLHNVALWLFIKIELIVILQEKEQRRQDLMAAKVLEARKKEEVYKSTWTVLDALALK